MNRAPMFRLMTSILIAGTIAVTDSSVAEAGFEAPARYAVDFDGDNSHIEVPHSASLNPTGPFTVEAWVLARDYQYPGHSDDDFFNTNIVDKFHDRSQSSEGSGYDLFLESGYPMFRFSAGPWPNEVFARSSELIDLHGYHHVAGTWDGEILRVFVDGRIVGDAVANTIFMDTTNPLVLGRRHTGDAYRWDGLIAEVRISSICRYATDFVPPHTFVGDESTMGLWLLDEGDGATVLDMSGNGNHGTISNGVWIHSIQPVYLYPAEDCLDLTAGGFAVGRSPWAVHLLPSTQYRVSVSGEAFLTPAEAANSFVLHAATSSNETTFLLSSDFDDSFPLENEDTLDFAMFFVDSDASDNSGALRVEIVPADPVAAPEAPTPTESSATLPRLLLRPNPASTSVSMGLTYMTDRQGAEFEVFAMDGRLVRRIPSASGAAEWDLLDSEGHRVAAGRYLVRAHSSTGSETEAVVVVH